MLDYLFLCVILILGLLQMGSYWGVDMSAMFQRNVIENILDQEVFEHTVVDLPWDSNILINRAECFLPSPDREEMINEWVDVGVLRLSKPEGPDSDDMY